MKRSIQAKQLTPLFLLGWLLATFCLAIFPLQETAAAASPISATFPLGVDANGLMKQLAQPDGDKLADAIASSNSGWVRFEFRATDPTNLQWYDRAIARLQSRGLHLMAVLIDPWLSCHTDTRQRDPELFAQWVRQVYLKGCGENKPGSTHQLGFDELTARYPYIQHWQIWNEPNVCGFFPGDLDICGYGLWRKDGAGGERVGLRWGMQKFGTLLATVYADRANKQVKIISGGILNAYNCSAEYGPICGTEAHPGPENCYKLQPWENYGCDGGTNLLMNSDAVQRFKRNYNRLPFDVLGLHPYQHSAWANGYVPPSVYLPHDIALNVRRFVDSSYPIWITEWSFDLANNSNQPPACNYPTPSSTRQGCERNIAALLEDAINGLNARPDLKITNLFWFNMADQADSLQTGLIDQTGRQRPAFYSFQTAASRLGLTSQQSFQADIMTSLLKQSVGNLRKLGSRLISSHKSDQ